MMKKIVLVLLYFVSIHFSLFAQNEKKGAFDKAVNYTACKIAYTYAEEYISKGKAKDYSERAFKSEKKAFEDAIKKQLENCTIDTAINKKELSNLLDGTFDSFKKKLFPAFETIDKKYDEELNNEELADIIINGVYQDKDFKDVVAKYDNVSELRDELREELIIAFETPPSKKEVQTKKEEAENNKKVIESDTEKDSNGDDGNKFTLPNWLLFLLLFLTSVLLFLYNFLKHKELNKKMEKLVQKNDFEGYKSKQQNVLNKKFTDLKAESNRIIEELEKLKPEDDKNSKPAQTIAPRQDVQNVVPEFKKTTVLYAKNPLSGNFNASSVNEDKNEKFYIFSIDPYNPNKANFEFYNTAYSIKVALGSPENFLYAVCESISPLNQNASRIRTIEPGIAFKRDGKWYVETKAKITYED